MQPHHFAQMADVPVDVGELWEGGWCSMSFVFVCFFFFSSRRRHTRFDCDWSSDVCSSDLVDRVGQVRPRARARGHGRLPRGRSGPFMTYEMYTCQGPSRESALPGIIGPIPMQTPRDASLPTAYSEALDALSLGPLWTALHVLLPNERVTSAVPHRWRWRDLRPLLLEAARLAPIPGARRGGLGLRNPRLPGAEARPPALFAGPGRDGGRAGKR